MFISKRRLEQLERDATNGVRSIAEMREAIDGLRNAVAGLSRRFDLLTQVVQVKQPRGTDGRFRKG